MWVSVASTCAGPHCSFRSFFTGRRVLAPRTLRRFTLAGLEWALRLAKPAVQTVVLAADGLSDLVAMGTVARWKRIR